MKAGDRAEAYGASADSGSTISTCPQTSYYVRAAARDATGRSRLRDGLDEAALQRDIGALSSRIAPGVLGVAVKDLTSGETWSLNGARPFPMQSIFKAPLAAAVLAAVDRGEVDLSRVIAITPADLSPPYSAIGARYPTRTSYTVEELLVAAAGGSDNTAADVLMALIGGPAATTAWLKSKAIPGMRIDRYERQFQLETLRPLSDGYGG
jgi:beta-lactamase class A